MVCLTKLPTKPGTFIKLIKPIVLLSFFLCCCSSSNESQNLFNDKLKVMCIFITISINHVSHGFDKRQIHSCTTTKPHFENSHFASNVLPGRTNYTTKWLNKLKEILTPNEFTHFTKGLSGRQLNPRGTFPSPYSLSESCTL